MKKMIKWLFLFALSILLCFDLSAETQFSVSGACRVNEEGTLYIYLVDDNSFSEQQASIRQKITEIGDVPREGKEINYRFSVPSGEYGIRCFLDTNGNGELDGGMFGPAEPWGMSWNKERIVKWPKFREIAFEVKEDFQVSIIDVE